MAVQDSLNIANLPFVLSGSSYSKGAETVAQDAARTEDMEWGTVMSYDPTNAKWVPFTDETADDGTQFPRGILLRALAAADIVAGDVTSVPIMIKADVVDKNQLVIENSKTLATVIDSPAGIALTVEDALRVAGIGLGDVVDMTGYENS
jgi:hypothetical protein